MNARALLSVSHAVLLVVCVTALAGCAGVHSRQNGGRAEGVVHAISIGGNENVSHKGLIERLALYQSVFDPVVLELDKQRIESYYQAHGYFSARVVKTQINRVGKEARVPGVVIRFVVEEGKPTHVGRILVIGAPHAAGVDEKSLRDLIALSAGDVFVYKHYAEGKLRIARRLAELSFAFARVTGVADVDRTKASAHIQITVDAGPVVRFGQVRIQGLDRIPENSVRERIAWREGDLFDPRKIRKTQEQLYQLGRFASIELDFKDDSRPPVANGVIRVTEANARQFKTGFGVGADPASYELRLRAGLVFPGLVDPLLTARFEVRPAYRYFPKADDKTGWGVQGTAGIERPDFLMPRLLLSSQLSYEVEDRQYYSARGFRLRASLGRTFLSDRLFVAAGWEFQLLTLFDINFAIDDALRSKLGMENPYVLGFFDQTVGYDGRDDAVITHRGGYVALRFEEAGPQAAGTFDYIKALLEARAYVPAHKRLTLAARARLGVVLAGQGTVPLTQRYFAGGASSQRGFALGRLSPFATNMMTSTTVPIGGEALFEASIEARFEAFRFWGSWHSVVLFFDGADVRDELSALDVGHLHWAVGTGVRIRTPVGAIRGDIGFRLNRTGPGEPDEGSVLAWHISLGEAF